MPVDHVDGHRMLACATQNERVISRAVQTREDGGVRIDLIECEGKTLLIRWRVFIGRMPPMLQLRSGVKTIGSGRPAFTSLRSPLAEIPGRRQ
jgi:hypothetical protein